MAGLGCLHGMEGRHQLSRVEKVVAMEASPPPTGDEVSGGGQLPLAATIGGNFCSSIRNQK